MQSLFLGTPSPGRPPPPASFPARPLSRGARRLSTSPGRPVSFFLLCTAAVWTRLRGGSSGLRRVSPLLALFSSFPSLRVSVRRDQGRRRWGCQNLNSWHRPRDFGAAFGRVPPCQVTALLSNVVCSFARKSHSDPLAGLWGFFFFFLFLSLLVF